MSATPLHIRGLTVASADRRIVDDVYLDIPRSTVVALIGASGSGKTTIARALLGRSAPGLQVTWSSAENTAGARPRFAYVPQHPARVLNPGIRIGAPLLDIAAAAATSATPRETLHTTVRDVLDRVGFPSDPALLRRFPHQLSGGQQQRLAIAHALLMNPDCIILDEPTTGQDPVHRELVLGEIERLSRGGVAVLMLTHDMDAVRRLADTVTVIDAGRVAESGAAHSVLGHPRTRAARTLLSETGPRHHTTVAANPLLEIGGLCADFRGKTVVAGVDLSIGRGEAVALVGPSGCGKTTIGRCIVGVHRAAAGEILFHGAPLPGSLRHRTGPQQAAIGYVHQDTAAALDPYRSAWDQIVAGPRNLRGLGRAEAEAAARESLATVGLPEATARRRACLLSGGEAQRAALARALAVKPELLICDEVTTGLDPAARATVTSILRGAVDDEGLSLLLISHDRTVVSAIADRVVDIGSPPPPPPGARDRPDSAKRRAGAMADPS